MPELEEADIWVMEDTEKEIEILLKSITTVKCLSICIRLNNGYETVYRERIVFSQLENLKLCISSENWSMLLVELLKDSPNLKILNVFVNDFAPSYREYESVIWSNNEGSVLKYLLNSLETFKFEGFSGEPEDWDFLRFISKHARYLNLHQSYQDDVMFQFHHRNLKMI